MKKLGIVLLIFTVLILVTSVVTIVPNMFAQIRQVHPGYNINNLKNNYNQNKTFMAFFGTKSCSHCKKFYKNIQNSNHQLNKEIVNTQKRNSANETFVYYYYDEYSWLQKSTTSYEIFKKELISFLNDKFNDNETWKKLKTDNTKDSVLTLGTPFVMLFKEKNLKWVGSPSSVSAYSTFIEELRKI